MKSHKDKQILCPTGKLKIFLVSPPPTGVLHKATQGSTPAKYSENLCKAVKSSSSFSALAHAHIKAAFSLH